MHVLSCIWQIKTTALLASILALLASIAPAVAETLDGPLQARVLRVLDGDTLEVAARIWLGQEITVLVRLDGVDAPERRAGCAAERQAAGQARDFVAAAVDARPVALSRIRYGKYAGRVLARIMTEDGRDLSEALIAARLARPYDGGRRHSWC